MNFQSVQKQLRHARAARNLGFGLVVLLGFLNVALVYKVYSQSNQVILIPTSVSDGMVARGAVDKRYVEALALDAVYGLYNASPANLNYGRTVIERLAAVANRSELLHHYDEVATDIRERDISTVFYPKQIEHNLDAKTVVIAGNLQTYLNTVLISDEPRRILLNFVTEAGSVRLSRISRLEVEP